MSKHGVPSSEVAKKKRSSNNVGYLNHKVKVSKQDLPTRRARHEVTLRRMPKPVSDREGEPEARATNSDHTNAQRTSGTSSLESKNM